MRRGEVWWAELGPPAGGRPVVLLSRNEAYAVRDFVIVAPVTTPAAVTQVDGLTSMLGYVDMVRVIDEQPKDLAEYGLTDPRIRIDFKTVGETAFGGLLIGRKTPTGENLYAKRTDQDRVLLIGAHQESSLSRTTFDLRDKTVLTVRRDQVDAIEISVSGERLGFKKDADRWTMVSPVAARADFGAVDGLIGSIETAQMKSVVSDTEPTPTALRSYGLDRPSVTAAIGFGSARATLLLGKEASADTFYAKDLSKTTVMTVEKLLADDLKKQADTYRRKEVFESQASAVTRAEFTRNGQTIVLERAKGEGANAQDSWRRLGPNPGEVDKDRVETLLAQLAESRALAFTATTANTGLRAPAMTVLVKFDGGSKEERVSFGRNASDVYASRPDEPGALKIEAAKLDKAIETLDALSK